MGFIGKDVFGSEQRSGIVRSDAYGCVAYEKGNHVEHNCITESFVIRLKYAVLYPSAPYTRSFFLFPKHQDL